jgi:hypothetical protein
MDGFDNATWQALGLVLTMVGLGISAVLWSRRGAVSGLRGAAWSLLPLAAALTGVLRLAWDIGDSVARWAARLVFSPVVWLGVVVAMVSVLLFVVTGFARRRGTARGAPRAPGASGASGAAGASPSVATRSDRRLTSRQSAPPATTTGGGKAAQGGAGDDMADIEAILRKHGIS